MPSWESDLDGTKMIVRSVKEQVDDLVKKKSKDSRNALSSTFIIALFTKKKKNMRPTTLQAWRRTSGSVWIPLISQGCYQYSQHKPRQPPYNPVPHMHLQYCRCRGNAPAVRGQPRRPAGTKTGGITTMAR